jgi:hypothetical protein
MSKTQGAIADMGNFSQRNRQISALCKIEAWPALQQFAVKFQWFANINKMFIPYGEKTIRRDKNGFISGFFLVGMEPHIDISRAVWPDRNFIKFNYRWDQSGRNISQEVPPVKWNKEMLTTQTQVSEQKNK